MTAQLLFIAAFRRSIAEVVLKFLLWMFFVLLASGTWRTNGSTVIAAGWFGLCKFEFEIVFSERQLPVSPVADL